MEVKNMKMMGTLSLTSEKLKIETENKRVSIQS